MLTAIVNVSAIQRLIFLVLRGILKPLSLRHVGFRENSMKRFKIPIRRSAKRWVLERVSALPISNQAK